MATAFSSGHPAIRFACLPCGASDKKTMKPLFPYHPGEGAEAMHAMTRRHFFAASAAALALPAIGARASGRAAHALEELRLAEAVHAFEHLGAYSFQAPVAAEAGANIIYATGIGGDAYGGLPEAAEFQRRMDTARAYVADAKNRGITIALGYLCATSIVNLGTFDAHWSDNFRAQFAAPPAAWLQEGRGGAKLDSWYGGDYRPACMNHPDWRAYQREMVRLQFETGHDGIFFDNPTVHTKGCYCAHCMAAFAAFLRTEGADFDPDDLERLRRHAETAPRDFLRFRVTIARDFLGHIRDYARAINPNALITANNSLNTPNVLYSQCRGYGYSPFEMSRTEDFVVIEDMTHQPRSTDDGKVFEYGPTYRQLQAICHGRPVVAVTIAEADYHTPPNLLRLAMAEALAHQASYLAWTTWPEEERPRMIAAMRKQVDFYRRHKDLIQGVEPLHEAALFLPMRRFLDSDTCAVSSIAAELTRANIQFRVFCEEDFKAGLATTDTLILEDRAVLTPDEARCVNAFASRGGRVLVPAELGKNWIREAFPAPIVTLSDHPRLRVCCNAQRKRVVAHVINLDIRRRSSFEDEVFPAEAVQLCLRLPKKCRRAYWLDADQPEQALDVELHDGCLVCLLPTVTIAGMAVFES
jgi:hypothetical protein